jgi:histone-lysine N-methyltransferase SETMAR
MEGIIHYELLELIITAERYRQQLCHLGEEIQQKLPGRRHGVILQHDNGQSHTANMMKVAIQELNWEILSHPPYSPDLTSLDYHLFGTLSNNLCGVSFNDAENLPER